MLHAVCGAFFKQAMDNVHAGPGDAPCSEPAPIPSAERCALHAGGGGHMHVGVDMHTYIAAAARSALERSAS